MRKLARYKGENVISYAEYGDANGYPVFVNHGLIASIEDGYLFERLLQRKSHLICIARPGYGESSPYLLKNVAEWAEIVSVLVDELGLSQFDVLGMSSGAPYSYAIGYRFPDQVRNIYIFSGIPALYDEEIQKHWPYELNRDADMPGLERLSHELFFSNVSKEDLEKNDIRDSMAHHCFGIALDLKIRCMDWGFRLSDVRGNVYMRHSRTDNAVPFVTALRTSKLLPNCRLQVAEGSDHFSKEALDDFIEAVIAKHYKS